MAVSTPKHPETCCSTLAVFPSLENTRRTSQTRGRLAPLNARQHKQCDRPEQVDPPPWQIKTVLSRQHFLPRHDAIPTIIESILAPGGRDDTPI